MSEHDVEPAIRAWFARQPAGPPSPELWQRVAAIPTTARVTAADRLASTLAWRGRPLPSLALALLVVALATALVAATALVGSGLLESRPLLPPVVPAVVDTPRPSEPPAASEAPVVVACPVLEELVAAEENLRAVDPWNVRETTAGALLAAYERFRVAAISATGAASPTLASELHHTLPGIVEGLGAAVAAAVATTPAGSPLPTGRLGELHALIQWLRPDILANWPCEPVGWMDPGIVMTSSGAGCSPVTSAVEPTADGFVITASRGGTPWARVRVADVGLRTSYGTEGSASTPAPGWVFLEARIAYEALRDGVLVRARSLPIAEFDQQPDGAVARELANPVGAPAPPAADAPLRAGEVVEGTAVYEVPATGWVALTGQWLLVESPAPVWRYWTLPIPGGVRYCIYADGAPIEVRAP
jgi:hypothetical protein